MPVFSPRTRLVNFRLSEEEYQELKSSCSRSSARSISDYARAAVLSGRSGKMSLPATLVAVNDPPGCMARWDRLELVVNQLETLMRQLAKREMIATHG